MGLPTTYKGLIKADEGEQYDVDTLNANLDAIDAGLATFDTVYSTYNTTNFDATSSRFTRLRVGNVGIIICHLVVVMKTAQSLPSQGNANLTLITDLVPPGYRSPATLGNMSGILSGVGRGDHIHYALASGRTLTMRSGITAITTVAGVTLLQELTWVWDGVL